jgi:protein SCO1/2
MLLFALSACLPASAAADAGESIYNLSSAWQDQDGHALQPASLKGEPVVLAMAYTSCQASCPLIVEDMRKIERALPGKTQVRFVLASFDSKRDTPARLKTFASAHKLDKRKWTLLHGDDSAVRDLAAVLGVRYRKDADGEFAHSNLVSLLDAEGVIKFQQGGVQQKPEPFVARLKEMGK